LKKPSPISVADYLASEELSPVKHEYLGGEVHAMAGATNGHNEIAVNALGALGSQLRGKPCRPFNSNTKVRIDLGTHTRFYYPDVMVVCHPNPRSDHFQDHPVVVIEVTSESTRRTDRGEKAETYMRIPSLRVLLLVEAEMIGVAVWRRGVDGGFAVERYDDLAAVIPLPEIEAEMPLAELYGSVHAAG
jgi:Uma2 family endonuclease